MYHVTPTENLAGRKNGALRWDGEIVPGRSQPRELAPIVGARGPGGAPQDASSDEFPPQETHDQTDGGVASFVSNFA